MEMNSKCLLGQDGAVAFLQHGSGLIKAHACRVQPVKSTLPIIPENEEHDKNIDQVQEAKIQDLYEDRTVIMKLKIITYQKHHLANQINTMIMQ